ncbi:MAG: hypothetical protein ACJA13_002617 [Paraglaciecola sp.]|jgi:hypothetical protein
MNGYKVATVTSAVLLLTSCSTSLQEYQDTTPAFSLKEYFNGDLTAWGIVQDYSRKLTKRFCVEIKATWQGNKGQLDESFYFNDGSQQSRVWEVEVKDDGSVTGTAGDVVGEAKGAALGSAFHWTYTLTVPIDGTSYDFAIDDWMYQLDATHVMNRSYMQKFGVTVAEFSIFFDKSAPQGSCQNL